MKELIVVVVLLILSVTANIYQYGDRKELNIAVDTAISAKDKWKNKLDIKQDEVDGMAFQCQVVGEELERQSLENALLKEESDNAKRLLREKDIVGNFDRWIEENPANFGKRATAESNRVLSNIVKISEGNRGPSADNGPKESSMPNIGNTKNTDT